MKKKKQYWIYDIVRWNNDGSKLLEKRRMTVQRENEYFARSVVRKKFPPSKGYFEELRSKKYK